MHRQLRPLAGLALLTLLIAAPGLALAHGDGPQQTVDGYLVTLVVPKNGWYTGSNPVEVILWDARGMAIDATVMVAPLAYAPADDGHGATHSEAEPAHSDGPAAPEEAQAAEEAAHDDGHAAEDDAHDSAEAAHSEGTAHADEHSRDGQGLALAPVALAPSEELGEYRGELAFDKAGTYRVSVVFVVDGEERGAIFDVAVAQYRPRGLVLGGFAIVNGLAIGVAGLLKWRGPRKPAARPARPAATTTTPEE